MFIGTSGFLDSIPLADVRRFEQEFIAYLKLKNPELLPSIAQKKELTTEISDGLKGAATEFSKTFARS